MRWCKRWHKKRTEVGIENAMEDISFVVFDPNKNNDDVSAENVEAAAEFPNVSGESTPSLYTQNQLEQKLDNDKLFECTHCKYSTPRRTRTLRNTTSDMHEISVVLSSFLYLQNSQH